MAGWIFNASPIILLGKIDQLGLIDVLAPEFRIPWQVVEEIGRGRVDDPAVRWLAQTFILDHIVDTPPTPLVLAEWNLGMGETAVLSLALEDKGSVVVLDDMAARRFAMTFQVPLLGTLACCCAQKTQG